MTAASMKTILFVCTGNVCRSPMAEGLFRHAVKGRGDFRVLSAGVGAIEGQPPRPYAVQVLRELGIDISQQRSRMLTAEVVNQADYIFGMTHGHVDAINLLYPHAAEKTFLLREFDETLDVFEKDISDPIGGSYEVYLDCRDQIEQGIASMLKFIDQTFVGVSARADKAVVVGPEQAKKIADAFLDAHFEGGRHARRVDKFEHHGTAGALKLERVDPEVAEAIRSERRRQQENIELIASENFTSPAVMEAQGSVLTNKYAEGYPHKRWYGGCEHVDTAEQLAIDRARSLFGAEHANVQPHCGSSANMAVYFAFLRPGDKMLTMDLSHGGHLTHGNKANFSGRFFEIIHYGVRKEDEQIDYDQLARMAQEHRPKMITVGASAYPRVIDFQRMGQIAREVGALLLADIAHLARLVAAGLHPSPKEHADFVTTTTHKTQRGPRRDLLVRKAQYVMNTD